MELLHDRRMDTIVVEIARYIREHPDAADSLAGVHRWWLTRLRYEESATQVEQALNQLVREGIVVGERMLDGTTLYRSAIGTGTRLGPQEPS